MNPVHTFPPCFPDIDFNIILLSTPRSASGLFPSGFPATLLYEFLSSMRATYPSYLICLDLITLILFDEDHNGNLSFIYIRN